MKVIDLHHDERGKTENTDSAGDGEWSEMRWTNEIIFHATMREILIASNKSLLFADISMS